MKHSFLVVLIACLIGSLAAAEPVNFLSKPLTAGKASLTENGYIISQVLGTANFSPDLRLPIQLIYNSASEKTGLFGYAWSCPQLESSAVPQRDGVLWTSPWGEKIKFFPKKTKNSKDAIKIELYEEARKGRGFFSPYSEWEAQCPEKDFISSGDWVFNGLRSKKGWKFIYRGGRLDKIAAPSGRSIEFSYSRKKIVRISQERKAFIEIDYDGINVSGIRINGIPVKLAYAESGVRILPKIISGKMIETRRPMLHTLQSGELERMEFSYTPEGYLSGIKRGNFRDVFQVETETLAERRRNIQSGDRKKNIKHSGKVAGRLLSDSFLTYRYGAGGQPGIVSLTNKLKQTAAYNYDKNTGIFKIKEFSGRQYTIYYFMRYDVAYLGKVRQIVDGRGRVVASYRYDKLSGNVTRIRDMAENDINFKYDGQGNLILVEKRGADEQAAGPVMSFAYAACGKPSAINILDENGEAVRSTRIDYDRARQPVMVDNGQQKSMIRYNRFGYPVQVVDSFNQISKIEYDNFNRMISTENPFGVKTLLAYNAAGLVTKVERRDGDEVLSFLEVDYDPAGQPVGYRDQRDRVKKFDRDAFGRVVREYFPDDTTVEYKYNALGQLVQVLDQNRHKIRFDWNKFGLDSRTTAANQLTDYVYDKYGLLSAMVSKFKGTKRTDRRIGYEYDDLDRVVKISYGGNEVETFRYNTWGRLIASTKGGKSATYKYDYFGRLIEKTEGALVNRYEYNAYGQRTYRLTRNGTFRQEERKSYDRFGRLVKIESGNKVVLYRYNGLNQLESQILNGMRIRYEYTKYGQLKKKTLISQ